MTRCVPKPGFKSEEQRQKFLAAGREHGLVGRWPKRVELACRAGGGVRSRRYREKHAVFGMAAPTPPSLP